MRNINLTEQQDVLFYLTHLECIKLTASDLHHIHLIGLGSAINRHYNHCQGGPEGYRQPLAF